MARMRDVAVSLKARHWNSLDSESKDLLSNAHSLYLLVALAASLITLAVGLLIGQWQIVFVVILWSWVAWGVLVYVSAVLALACIRPKEAPEPSILGIKMQGIVRFMKGALLVLVGAGLGLYVQSTGEYLAVNADDMLGDKALFTGPTFVKAYMYGFYVLSLLVQPIIVLAILYFGLSSAWDLWRSSVTGRLRAAGTLRAVIHLFPSTRHKFLARWAPKWFFDLTRPSLVVLASFNVLMSAIELM